MSKEKMDLVVAENQMKEEHIAAAKDILEMIEQYGNTELAQRVRIRYGLDEIKFYDLEDSPFFRCLQKANMNGYIQGHLHNGKETDVRYPVISVNDDIRKFNKLYEVIKNDS